MENYEKEIERGQQYAKATHNDFVARLEKARKLLKEDSPTIMIGVEDDRLAKTLHNQRTHES